MSSAVEKFVQFLDEYESEPDFKDIDISVLINDRQNYSPIPVQLKYSDTEEAYANMPTAIILNFIEKQKEGKVFGKYGLKALKNIVTKSLNDDTKAQLTLLIHISKMNLPRSQSALYFKEFQFMTIKYDLTNQLEKWKELALKVIQHKDIKSTINSLTSETFGNHLENKIIDSMETIVSIKFVSSFETDLRGFSGLNELFINERHFVQKMLNWSTDLGSIELLDRIMKMDIVSVTIHEIGHVRVRQCYDNLNMSTPNFMVQKTENPKPADVEFGCIVEKHFFGGQVDWLKSCNSVEPYYIDTFLNGIMSNTELPSMKFGDSVKYRGQPAGMGADFVSNNSDAVE